MAHEVEALLYTGETPWHRIGDRISEEQSNDIDWIKTHPAVGASVWFDTDTHPSSRENWRIDSTAASLAAYKAMSNDPVFNG